MNLRTKLGIGILGLSLVTNITARSLSKYYNHQKVSSIVALENTILKTNPSETKLDKAINSFERYEKKRNYADKAKNMSYVITTFGGALAFGWNKIKISIEVV